MMSSPVGDLPHVLVVDDNEASRETLQVILAREQVAVHAVDSGPAALAFLAEHHVDVLLLDVMMPGMDGFEVCRRMKADPALAPIPIILVTALDSTKDMLRGLESGAEEFVSKPVNRMELRARVRSMLRMKKHYDEARALAADLVELERKRQALTSFLVHDLKNPLAVIQMSAEYCLAVPNVTAPVRSAVADISQAVATLDRMVLDMLDVARSEESRLAVYREPVDVGALASDVVGAMRPLAVDRQIAIAVVDRAAAAVLVDRELTRRILANLLDNAVKYGPAGTEVSLEVERAEGALELRVRDSGRGIPVEARSRVFDRFARAELTGDQHRGRSRGLGLAFCRLAAEAHGGRIWIEDNVPAGAVFCVSLPIVDAAEPA
jgi:signal transduction histidine kinase